MTGRLAPWQPPSLATPRDGGPWFAWVLVMLPLFTLAQESAPTVEELLDAAQAAQNAGETARAGVLAAEAVDRASELGDPTALGNALRKQASVAILLTEYDEAEATLHRAIGQFDRTTPSADLGHTQHQMAMVFRYRGEYATALQWLRAADKTFTALDDANGHIRVYNTFGVVYDFMGELDRSLEWHSRALALSRQTEDQNGIANGLYAIGQVHRQLKEHAQALMYFEDALAIDEATGNQKHIAYSHMKVGSTHASLGAYSLARQHFATALAIFEKMNTPRDRHWAMANLAELDLHQEQVVRGLDTLNRVLALSLERGWPVLASDARFALAEHEARIGRHEAAIEHLELIIEEALTQEAMSDVLNAYEFAADVYEAAGQPAEALLALRKYAETRDMLFDRRRTSVIAAMQGEAEFKRQAVALELAEKNRALAILALEREQTKRLIGLGALLALFIVALLAYGRIMTHRQNRRLAREVASQTRTVVESHEQLQQAYAAVDQASLTDPLTGIANRRFLDRHLEHDTRQARDTATTGAKDLVFFLVDLDHFKSINDRYGHAAGDTVLVAVSRLLEREFRASDYLVRWGGEEYLVVARFIDRREAPVIAERVRQAVAGTEIPLGERRQVRCTCSIGFAAFPLTTGTDGDATPWQDVVALADAALYDVKHGERDGWAGYFAVTAEVPSRPVDQWVADALRRGALRRVASGPSSVGDGTSTRRGVGA